MQTLRPQLRRIPQQAQKLAKPTTTTTFTSALPATTTTRRFYRKSTPAPATMSLFPRFTNEFAPLFRMFDDYERQFHNFDERMRTFTPKFDVKEQKDSYELSGEFPGVEQKDINIEWTDSQTLTIHGRHEEVKEEGQRPSAQIEEGGKSDKKGKQPTVEDEGAQTQVAKKGGQEVAKKTGNEPRYWVSERSVGEFHRSFAFPSPVDQDAVKASLKNGILSVVVPKAKAKEPRRVKIE